MGSTNMTLSTDAVMNLAMGRIPKTWINKGVTACAMLGLIMPTLLMGWDLFFPAYMAFQSAGGKDNDNDEGYKSEKAEASADQANTTHRPVSTAMTKSKLRKMVI